ncbi:MAG: hypothetical protein MJZ92_00070 [Paludibacteraceae bacterium]|nr:hypothetical protein [Paludibacteraceae bacterium]
MKILVAPLNWGLGHASRCIPLIRDYLAKGDEVVLGGDGNSLTLLAQHFPQLRTIGLASLQLRYSASQSQVLAMLKALPQLFRFAWIDHHILNDLLQRETFDLVVSDNRFGLFSRLTRCVYITHQLHICLPDGWHWLEPLCSAVHRAISNRYDEIWVPDLAQDGLSGILGHPKHTPHHARYIGLLSRFSTKQPASSATETYDIVAVLSGLEPQRTLFEKELITRFMHQKERVLIIRGLVAEPNTKLQLDNLTLASHIDDLTLVAYLQSAKTIIARSGYSTIMDLATLHLLDKAELHPTPGQPEQIYLSRFLGEKSR